MLTTWCSENNLEEHNQPTPLYINGECVERVHTFRFLGVQIADELCWTENISAIIKKAQQGLHFLRVLKKNNLDKELLLAFYRSSMERLRHLHLIRELH